MFESLTELASASPWTYAVVFAIAALDAVFPLVPSETVLVAAAALAGSGKLELGVILLAGAAGAFLGDNVAYAGGRLLGARAHDRIVRVIGASRFDWARRQLEARGPIVIVVARFVPGGRTATMLAAGAFAMRWRRFAAFDLLAGAVWACYGGLIGYFGGTAFEDEPWKGLLLALGLAFAAALVGELLRRAVARARRAGIPAEATPKGV